MSSLPTTTLYTLDKTTLSQATRIVELVYQRISKVYPEARPAIIVIYNDAKNRGHWWLNAWSMQGTETKRDEIHISSNLLAEGPQSVLRTLLHEAAHSINWTRQTPDTSRGNRYHNKTFKDTAESLGLITDTNPSYGIITTGLTPECIETWKNQLLMLESACTIFQPYHPGNVDLSTLTTLLGIQGTATNKTKQPNRQLKYTCTCPDPRIIRMSKKTFDAGPIKCEICGENFSPSEK